MSIIRNVNSDIAKGSAIIEKHSGLELHMVNVLEIMDQHGIRSTPGAMEAIEDAYRIGLAVGSRQKKAQ